MHREAAKTVGQRNSKLMRKFIYKVSQRLSPAKLIGQQATKIAT